MPKGAKKRAKLKKKQQQQGHHQDDGANHDALGSGSDTNANANNGNGAASGRRDHNLRIPNKASHVDASEDSMESSEEMVTPRAAGSEPDEEDRKAAADVPVVVHQAPTGDAAGEEVMVDALSPPEPSGQGKDDAEVEVHAVVQEPEVKDVQEPEVKDVVVDEAPPAVQVQEPAEVVAEAPVVNEVPEEEVKREVAKVHPVVHEPEPSLNEAAAAAVAGETPPPPAVHEQVVVAHEPEVKAGNVVIKDSTEVSRSREVDVQTTEVARGPAVAVASSAHQATWWNCCGLFDAFSGSER